jgi:hypothetical protein
MKFNSVEEAVKLVAEACDNDETVAIGKKDDVIKVYDELLTNVAEYLDTQDMDEVIRLSKANIGITRVVNCSLDLHPVFGTFMVKMNDYFNLNYVQDPFTGKRIRKT